MTTLGKPSPQRLLARLREWRRAHRERWVEKQSSKRAADVYTDYWKGGGGGPSGSGP